MEDQQPIIKSRWTSPLGEMLLATQGDCVLALDYSDFAERFELLLSKGHAGSVVEGQTPDWIIVALNGYFTGDLAAIEGLNIAYAGTEFQNAVWRALREIPAGRTWSYGQLAAHLNNPKAVRAVGRTNGLNPVAIIGPCHRVVGADGTLTGYAGGLERKRWLLDHEAKHSHLL